MPLWILNLLLAMYPKHLCMVANTFTVRHILVVEVLHLEASLPRHAPMGRSKLSAWLTYVLKGFSIQSKNKQVKQMLICESHCFDKNWKIFPITTRIEECHQVSSHVWLTTMYIFNVITDILFYLVYSEEASGREMTLNKNRKFSLWSCGDGVAGCTLYFLCWLSSTKLSVYHWWRKCHFNVLSSFVSFPGLSSFTIKRSLLLTWSHILWEREEVEVD